MEEEEEGFVRLCHELHLQHEKKKEEEEEGGCPCFTVEHTCYVHTKKPYLKMFTLFSFLIGKRIRLFCFVFCGFSASD